MKTFIILLLFFIHQQVFAARTFTNEDIEKYRTPSEKESSVDDKKETVDKKIIIEKKVNVTIKNEQDMDYWCRTLTRVQEDVDRAERDLKEGDDALWDAKYPGRPGGNRSRAEERAKRASERLDREKRN